MKYPYLAAQLFNVPLMARPESAEVFANAFVQILVGEAHAAGMPRTADDAARPHGPEAFAGNLAGTRYRDKRYIVTDSGVGILPIYGALSQRAGEITPDCTELQSYQRLGRTFDAMVADPDVKAILLEVDSPGGQVAGNFELARRVMAARGTKPVWAHANEIAFSGGYSIAASAEKLFTPDTGMVGSIGVIMLHMSQAERDEKQGYKYTAIYAGGHKNDHNPHFALSDEARGRLQSIVDSNYEIFVAHVAAARGIDVEAVRKTEASILEAKPALEARLIDGISTFAETLAALEKRMAGTSSIPGAGLAAQQPKETAMSESNKPAATATDKPAEEQPNVHGAHPGGITEVQQKARTEERARVQGILALEEAKGRPTLAQHLAIETDMSIESAKATLAKSPLENQQAGKGPFANAMRNTANPPVGSDAGGDEEDTQALVKSIVAHIPQPAKAN